MDTGGWGRGMIPKGYIVWNATRRHPHNINNVYANWTTSTTGTITTSTSTTNTNTSTTSTSTSTSTTTNIDTSTKGYLAVNAVPRIDLELLLFGRFVLNLFVDTRIITIIRMFI